jgi:hypothetical protein
MNRYKPTSAWRPVGWRNESLRHSLAAKGLTKKPGFYHIDPDEYLKESPLDKPYRSGKYMLDLKKSISKNGVEQPTILEYDKSGKLVAQEGRHRAIVSKELGKKLPVIIDAPGDKWHKKYFDDYPEDAHLKESSVGELLKKGKISAALAYSDRVTEKKLRKTLNIPDNYRDLGRFL